MKDSGFKSLNHQIGVNVIASKGTQVAKGYKPDITIKNSQGQTTFILESEQKTDRKAFLGDLLKAEKYSEEQAASPELIIVMQPFENTTTLQITDHIRPYAQWLSGLKNGKMALSSIQVLSDDEYLDSIASGEIIGSEVFKKRGHIV